MRRLGGTLAAAAVALILTLQGCGGPPQSGDGVKGPQGVVGPQTAGPSSQAGVTVIEDTNVLKSREHPFSGFTRLEISDGFDVTVSRGPGFAVAMEFEETAEPYVRISQSGDTLAIMLEPDRAYNMVNITLDVEITMPALTEIVLRDGADVVVKGLAGYETDVDFLSSLEVADAD